MVSGPFLGGGFTVDGNKSGSMELNIGGSQVVEAPPIGEAVNDLPVQVALHVPSTEEDEIIATSEFERRVEETKRWFDERFGGDTSTRGMGGYVMDEELIEEPVAIVESSMSIERYKRYADEFADRIRQWRKEWKQDTILYKVEDRVFVYPQKDYIDHDETMDEIIRVL
jgi:hypothetical protein